MTPLIILFRCFPKDIGEQIGDEVVLIDGVTTTVKTAHVPCAQERGQTLAACAFGVARGSGGDLTAAVTFPSGFTRLLFFVHGTFVSASPTMSGAGRDTDWRVEDGIHFIRADDQRFEIPEVLLFGEDFEPERSPPSE